MQKTRYAQVQRKIFVWVKFMAWEESGSYLASSPACSSGANAGWPSVLRPRTEDEQCNTLCRAPKARTMLIYQYLHSIIILTVSRYGTAGYYAIQELQAILNPRTRDACIRQSDEWQGSHRLKNNQQSSLVSQVEVKSQRNARKRSRNEKRQKSS